jgi:hypothetical protein
MLQAISPRPDFYCSFSTFDIGSCSGPKQSRFDGLRYAVLRALGPPGMPSGKYRKGRAGAAGLRRGRQEGLEGSVYSGESGRGPGI